MLKIYKKLFTILLIASLLFIIVGCNKVTAAVIPNHSIMQASISIPDDVSKLANAYMLSADIAANQVIDKDVKFKPDYISFNFTSNDALNQDERNLMQELFKVYGVTVDDRGLNPPKRSIEERARGIVIGFPSTTKYQTSDSDLTIPVDVYFGTNAYTYACDFKIQNDKYILFRWENVYVQKVDW